MTADKGIINGMLTRQLDEIIHQAVNELFTIAKSIRNPLSIIDGGQLIEVEGCSKNSKSSQHLFDGLNDMLFCDNNVQGRVDLIEQVSQFIGDKLRWFTLNFHDDTTNLTSQCNKTLDNARSHVTEISERW